VKAGLGGEIGKDGATLGTHFNAGPFGAKAGSSLRNGSAKFGAGAKAGPIGAKAGLSLGRDTDLGAGVKIGKAKFGIDLGVSFKPHALSAHFQFGPLKLGK
jgi:hypothetical protein